MGWWKMEGMEIEEIRGLGELWEGRRRGCVRWGSCGCVGGEGVKGAMGDGWRDGGVADGR